MRRNNAPLDRRYLYTVRQIAPDGEQVAFEVGVGKNGTVIPASTLRQAANPVVEISTHPRYNETRRKERRDDAAPSVNNVDRETRLRTIDDCAVALEVPDSRREAFAKMVGDFLDAEGEATARTKPALKWERDRLADETPAHFASRAGYLHRGEISTEDRALHKKLFNWLRTHKWPADVPYIPTLPEWNERQAAKLPELRETLNKELVSGELGDKVRQVKRLEAVVRRVTRAERIPAL